MEDSDNPFAVVVMAHLKAQETASGRAEERKQWKLRLIRLLYARGYERKDVLELFRFIDWLLILPPELERRFTEEVSRIEEGQGIEYITSVERIGMQRGLEQGMKQGLEQGVKLGSLEQAKIMLLEVLSVRFGPVSRELTGCIEQIADHEVLQELHRVALRCADVQEFTARLDASEGDDKTAS
ncbi:MAG: hypothetical protein Q3M30_17715 [Candidatus Electrothrix sp. Rat3]|nr:hypothetical protein [Candidatus Electrothrix rattekaaiensis]